MPKPLKNRIVECTFFCWRLYQRNGVWYADGRNTAHNLGRHSLGTHDADEARRLLSKLDRQKAEDLGLAPKTKTGSTNIEPVPLAEGRKLYEAHIGRPVVTGGVQPSTRKRYKAVFDKFLPFAGSVGVASWNQVTSRLLEDYAAFLKAGGPPAAKMEEYADKSVLNELTTIAQAMKWLIEDGHLRDTEPVKLHLRKPESQRAYCWRPSEVAAMVDFCRSHSKLAWLGRVIVALACTGLRISELAGLRWSDIDLEHKLLRLSDESGRSGGSSVERRRLKSGRSRTFPINAALLDVLKGLPAKSGYVFQGPRQGRLKPDTVRRLLVRDVLSPLREKFPTCDGGRGFADGRLHSFRHYFCSTCANERVPEQMLMAWLGHKDSEMVRHYYHLHDDDARCRMDRIDFLGGAAEGPLEPAKCNVVRKR